MQNLLIKKICSHTFSSDCVAWLTPGPSQLEHWRFGLKYHCIHCLMDASLPRTTE